MTNTTTQPPQDTQNPQKLPPGVVIGPDGKPCKICTAFRYWKPTKAKMGSESSNESVRGAAFSPFAGVVGTMGTLAYGQNNTTNASTLRPSEPPEGCPPDVEQLGRATWTFLHTTAAYYPTSPTPTQRTRMLSLLLSLPVLYPCTHCASHLGEEIKRSPPDVSGREGLSRWLCEQHNRVNERLGKPSFDCAIEKLDERWKDGPNDGRCD